MNRGSKASDGIPNTTILQCYPVGAALAICELTTWRLEVDSFSKAVGSFHGQDLQALDCSVFGRIIRVQSKWRGRPADGSRNLRGSKWKSKHRGVHAHHPVGAS